MIWHRVAEEFRNERERHKLLLQPYWERMIFRSKLRHMFTCICHAVYNASVLYRMRIREITQPGDGYRRFERIDV